MPQTGRYLDYRTFSINLSSIRRGFAPVFVNYKKGALDLQPQVIQFTSCLPRVGDHLWVILASSTTKTVRHDIVERLLKVALNTKNQSKAIVFPDLWCSMWIIVCSFVRFILTIALSVLRVLLINLWYLQVYLKHIDTPRVFGGVRFSQSLVFYVVLCRSLFDLLSVLLWSLRCLSFDFF